MNGDHALRELTPDEALLLIKRVDRMALYAHAYSFHFNFRYNRMGAEELLQFAKVYQLQGIKIHLDDGEALSLRHANDERLLRLRDKAHELGLEIHLEVSSTDLSELSEAVRIGRTLTVTSIRCYPRYAGRVSEIIRWTIRDLRQLADLDPEGQFRFTVEQHEDLRGPELVQILDAVDNPNLKLLFDFTNMLNAYEQPLEALQAMAPYISDVHIKDAVIINENGGWGQRGTRSGEGEIPQARLLQELLLLGESDAQVVAYGLEEEVDYYAPALRFPGDGDDPFIPHREASETPLPKGIDLDSVLSKERRDAHDQVNTIHSLLEVIRQHTKRYL